MAATATNTCIHLLTAFQFVALLIPTTANQLDAAFCPEDRAVIHNDETISLSTFPCQLSANDMFSVSVVKKEKNLLYVHNFLADDEVDSIIEICSNPDRLDASPLLMHSATKESSYGTDNAVRTSSSCPLLFAYYYMPHIERLKSTAPELLMELELTWNITTRAANLLQVPAANIEPLQMLQYRPGQYYKPHHDHRAFYNLMNGYPDRASTMLLFLNDVASGGHLKFDRLGFQFVPRKGDAVVWSNLDLESGKVDRDMLHQGLPPDPGSEKMAINLWIREEALTSPQQAAQRQT